MYKTKNKSVPAGMESWSVVLMGTFSLSDVPYSYVHQEKKWAACCKATRGKHDYHL